ncbi:retinoic acid-induced protein 2 [Latimeria chalumnae]|uniref:Retinoic acid induced 2 n=1 Tax=Latimeria chalumnae TaxID=7897 RepID=H3A1D2_LATCH|nr:PREDICTED: retinoic acid-induced protein 2 [Latimeria chalumnae]|eukprot:XP_005997900.1 PREDICTED: retinoic acid-induced protein 2 [Latimeria chalumnae]
MDELYKDPQNLPMDVTNSPSALTSNKLENGVTQLITAEAWNINSTGLMKKALSPLVAVPAPSILTPPAESQSGMALKVAATVLQPICLGDSPVVLPIHLQVAGSTAPQISPSSNTPYVMTTQGPVPLPALLEQHMFQHLNSPLVLPQGNPCPTNPIHNNLFQGSSVPLTQPQLLDQKPSTQTQESGLPPLFQTPGFGAVLQDLFPSQSTTGPSACQSSPPESLSGNLSSVPPQLLSSPLCPLVPPATLLVPYPVIVPLPVPVPIPVPIPIPMPVLQNAESKLHADLPKATSHNATSCKGTQTSFEKEDIKPSDLTHLKGFPQFNRNTVIKLNSENEALDLSVRSGSLSRKSEIGCQQPQQDGALDLSITSLKKHLGHSSPADTVYVSPRFLSEGSAQCSTAGPSNVECIKTAESSQKVDDTNISGSYSEFIRQQKWVADQNGRPNCDQKTGNNIEIVSTSQTAKVIVSVKDAVPAIFCGKIKGLSGVSTKNFSFKRDQPQESMLQCYDVKTQPDPRENSETFRKPMKNRSVKLKKMNSQEIHILPIKKQRLAAFFPRK